ncbi:LppU/SCO3897 family protein [Nocardia sp. CA-128927]|uniref:LppU/SCO3897 family protein n=1 Tax=Nocardia sp. CA-128927 TaxID=3239975 RepID=UPI003D956854
MGAQAPDGVSVAAEATGAPWTDQQWPDNQWASQEMPVAQPDSLPEATAPSGGRRKWVWLALASVLVLVGSLLTGGYFLLRPEPIALAVGDCVSLEVTGPTEYGCADGKALYRIVAREAVVWPLESACMKYSDVTKGVGDVPSAHPEVVLCLAPTRFNTTDPGALQAGDCIEVTGAGDSVKRMPCAVSKGTRVLSTELHRQLPVTDQACRAQPLARQAYAQVSLGGRAIVLCALINDPQNVDSAQVGDCTNKDLRKLVRCDSPDAHLRVLTIRALYQRPVQPQCADVLGASAFSMTHNEKTDLVLAICLGPVDENAVIYSKVGGCVVSGGAGPATRSRRVDCADPAATHEVIDRHESNDGNCPATSAAWITFDPGVTTGVTICLARR